MADSKYILLVQATAQPEHREEIVAATKASLPSTLAEDGVVAFFQLHDAADPNKLIFVEVFASEEAHDAHMQKDYTKAVFATLKGRLNGEPTITRLLEL